MPNDSDEQLYLRLPQVLKLIPISRSTWYRGIQSGIYPKPIKLSDRISAWKPQDIVEFLTKLEQQGASNNRLPNKPESELPQGTASSVGNKTTQIIAQQ